MKNQAAHNHPEVAVLRQYNPHAAEFLRDLLFGDQLEKREKWFNLLKDPIFDGDLKTSLDE